VDAKRSGIGRAGLAQRGRAALIDPFQYARQAERTGLAARCATTPAARATPSLHRCGIRLVGDTVAMGILDPTKVWHGAAERGIHRRPADHHRSQGRRAAEEKTTRPAVTAVTAAVVVWTSDRAQPRSGRTTSMRDQPGVETRAIRLRRLSLACAAPDGL
jgi:hypothetical protein